MKYSTILSAAAIALPFASAQEALPRRLRSSDAIVNTEPRRFLEDVSASASGSSKDEKSMPLGSAKAEKSMSVSAKAEKSMSVSAKSTKM